MAPHWKCGSGQPVAGSNPALSAISARRMATSVRCRLSVTRSRTCGCARSVLGSAFASPPSRPLGRLGSRLAARTRVASRRDGLSFPSRARRGTSGALYLQSATAGLNPLPRSPFSNAARRCDVEDRVPRSGEPRTVSGPEGSSTKRSSSGAAERPGPSRSSWWARGTSRSTEGARQFDSARPPRPEEVVTSTVPHQALYRRWRAQTFGEIVGQEAVVETLRNAVRAGPGQPRGPVRRAARHRQDLARPDPGQGRQLHRPPGRRRLRPLPVVRLDPRGHDPRPDRDRRRQQPRHRRRPRPARAPAVPARPAPAQGLHPRRGAPDHQATPGTRSSSRSRSRPTSSSSCSPRPSRRASRRRSCRASSASTSGA